MSLLKFEKRSRKVFPSLHFLVSYLHDKILAPLTMGERWDQREARSANAALRTPPQPPAPLEIEISGAVPEDPITKIRRNGTGSAIRLRFLALIPVERREEEKGVPAHDLMVWILRSSTTTLRRWVMSPASRNTFISDPPPSPSLRPPVLFTNERSSSPPRSRARRGLVGEWLCSLERRGPGGGDGTDPDGNEKKVGSTQTGYWARVPRMSVGAIERGGSETPRRPWASEGNTWRG